jgi:hypothetical protein
MLENIVSFMINRPFQCVAYSGIAGLIIYNFTKCPYKLLLGSNPQETISKSQETISNLEETISNPEETIFNPEETITKLPLTIRFYEQVKNKYDCVILKAQPLREKIQNYYSNIINYNTTFIQPVIFGVVITGLVYYYRGNLIIVPNNLAESIKRIIAKSRNNCIRNTYLLK